MNWRAVGYQIPATRWKEPKKYLSMIILAIFLMEISRMDIMDFVEDEDDIMDCLGSKGEQFRDDAESSDSESLES
jgi:hypothetical protein